MYNYLDVPDVSLYEWSLKDLKPHQQGDLRVTFQKWLKGGYFLKLYHIWVVVDISHRLGPLGNNHNIVHLCLLLRWRRHNCNDIRQYLADTM